MEIIDLLSGFDLDKLKDSDIQAVARGLAVTFVLKPFRQTVYSGTVLDEAAVIRLRNACEQELIRYLHKAIDGNWFDKIGMVASVTRNAGKADMYPEVTVREVDPSEMLDTVKDMHIHHMSKEDYDACARAFSNIIFGQGQLAEMISRRAVTDESALRTIEGDVISRVYSFLLMAASRKNDLISMAEESKNRAEKK